MSEDHEHVDTTTPELSNSLLVEIRKRPEDALELLLGEKNGVFERSRIHTLLVLIEERRYDLNEDKFFAL